MTSRSWLAALLVCGCFDEGGTVNDDGGTTSADTTGTPTSTTTTTATDTSDTGDTSSGSETGDLCPVATISCPCGPADACDEGLVCEDAQCVSPTCGNGELDTGEVCDDGNVQPGDGCSPDCAPEPMCAVLHLGGNGNVTFASVVIEPDGTLQLADDFQTAGAHWFATNAALASEAMTRCAGHVYAALEDSGHIVRIPVGPGGSLGTVEPIQVAPVSGLACSFDGETLLAAGHASDTATVFRFDIGDNGSLTETDSDAVTFPGALLRVRLAAHPAVPSLLLASNVTMGSVTVTTVDYDNGLVIAPPNPLEGLSGGLSDLIVTPNGARAVLTGVRATGGDCIAVADLDAAGALLEPTVQTACEGVWASRGNAAPVVAAQQLLLGGSGAADGVALVELSPSPTDVGGAPVLTGHHHFAAVRHGVWFVGADDRVHTMRVQDGTITIVDSLPIDTIEPNAVSFQASTVVPCPG